MHLNLALTKYPGYGKQRRHTRRGRGSLSKCIIVLEKSNPMPEMNFLSDEEMFNFFVAEAKASFSGWDFSHISGTASRMVEAPLIQYT